MSGTAQFVRTLPAGHGDVRLYRVDPPMLREDRCCWTDGCPGNKAVGHEYVVVSKINTEWATETYIFPARTEAAESGRGDTNLDVMLASWGELPGSQQGLVSHEDVLRDAGYEVSS